MTFLEFQINKLDQAATSLISPGSIFSLPQLAVALAIALAFLAYRRMRRHKKVRPMVILRATASRRIIFHRSTYADLFYFFVNTFAIGGLIGWGLLSSTAVSELMLRALHAGFGPRAASAAPEWALRLGITLMAFLGYEFGYYVDHYLKHRIPFLWEFHKTHHTAEVLTPLTVFRVHPIDSLIFVDIVAIAIGALQAVFTYAVGKSANIYLVDGANVLTVVFLFLLAPLQHSQFWIPLRGLAGRILLSPAHHQIHHSADPVHYGRNLGSFLAVFDWLFGTLTIPEAERPRIKFGVVEPGRDPHSISALLIDPITDSLATLGAMPKSAAPGTKAVPPVAADAAHPG